MDTEAVLTPALGRHVFLRPGTSDQQVWSDVFNGLYHLPPFFGTSGPATVLDLGANIGLTAAHYQALWPAAAIVAVELDADNWKVAAKNFSGEIVCRAVAPRIGTVFYDNSVPSNAMNIGAGLEGATPARATTIEALVERYFGREVDFVKMDIEGGEWSLFGHPSWVKVVRTLLVELHPSRIAPRAKVCPERGRDGYSNLLCAGLQALRSIGFNAEPHAVHPHAVWAWR